VEPRLVPAAKAARRLHLTEVEFMTKRSALSAVGFPQPCPITGHFDLKAIDAWLDRRAGLSHGALGAARHAADVVAARLAANG
jgi:hypothetical protein